MFAHTAHKHAHRQTHTIQKPRDLIHPLCVTSEAGHNLTWQVMTETMIWYCRGRDRLTALSTKWMRKSTSCNESHYNEWWCSVHCATSCHCMALFCILGSNALCLLEDCFVLCRVSSCRFMWPIYSSAADMSWGLSVNVNIRDSTFHYVGVRAFPYNVCVCVCVCFSQH